MQESFGNYDDHKDLLLINSNKQGEELFLLDIAKEDKSYNVSYLNSYLKSIFVLQNAVLVLNQYVLV